jgi:Uri superfamily endonuclease
LGEATLRPTLCGTYILILRLPVLARLGIGRLGAFDFPAGWYSYVGSACGPGGLRGRLAHHLRPLRRLHWHVDYLRAAAPVEAIWWGAGDSAQEHAWAAALAQMPGAQVAAPRFGASDCRCPTHLYYFAAPPKLQVFSEQFTVNSVGGRLAVNRKK